MSEMKHTLFFCIAAALTLAACTKDDENLDSGPVAAQVTAGIGWAQTRASGTAWSAGDAIGISTTSNTQTQYTNMKYTTTGDGTFTHAADKGGEASGIFFQDTEEVTFRAYYPHSGDEDIEPGPIAVDTKDQAEQPSFDFLFATGATASKFSPTVTFSNETPETTGDADDHSFHHKMAQLNVTFRVSTDDGFAANQILDGTFNLGGLVHEGTFNTTDGTTTLTGSEEADWDITSYPHTDAAPARTYSLILLPQDLTNNALNVAVSIDGQTYYNNNAIRPNLQAGYTYTYTITVKNTGLVVSGCTITNWDNGTTGSGDAEM